MNLSNGKIYVLYSASSIDLKTAGRWWAMYFKMDEIVAHPHIYNMHTDELTNIFTIAIQSADFC